MKDVYPYTPRKTPHENLEHYFVARHDLLDELLNSLRNQAKARSLQHWMILGPRGLGKSHLAALLYHRVKNTPELYQDWIPLLMDEEEPEVFSLPTLLTRIMAVLVEELRAEDSAGSTEVLNSLDSLRRDARTPDQFYTDAVALLKDFTSLNQKRIVVILENTDDLVSKSLRSKVDIRKFRHLLQNENFILFIATTPTFFEGIEKQSEPLYGLFRLRRLDLLDFEQSMDLMRRWAEQAGNDRLRERLARPDFPLRVLYHLTGGNPRLLLFLCLTLSGQEEMEDAASTFGKLLEHDLTGFYSSRMRDIPDQQKPIVVALAKSRTNLTQKEIAEQTFLPVANMGTNINRLEKSGLVRAVTQKTGKNSLYGLTDHLFRLWYQWRTGWREQEAVQALIEFLAIWYRKGELASLAEGPGIYARYARQALELRQDENFRLLLYPALEETLPDLKGHFQRGDYQGAIHLLKSMADFNLELGSTLEEIKNMLDSKKSKSVEDWNYLGVAQGTLENYSGAEEAFQRAVDLDPNSAEGWFGLGLVRFIQDNNFGAEEALQRAVDLDPKSAEAWINLGFARFGQENNSGAEEAYQRAVDLDPTSAEAWSELGFVRGLQDNNTGAEEALQRAVDLDPNSAEAWYNLGVARVRQDKDAGAEEAFHRAVELDPNSVDAWFNLGVARFKQDNNTGAEEAYQRAVDLNPTSAEAWFGLGFARFGQDNNTRAEEAFQRAVDLDPTSAKAWSELGLARVRQDKDAGAEEAFQRAVDLDSNSVEAWINIGLARLGQNNHAGAEDAFLRAVDLDPKSAKAWINLGLARFEQDNNAGVEEAFQRAVELDMASAEAWYLLGVARLSQVNNAGAEEAFKRAVDLDSNSAKAWFGLGFARVRQDKDAGAEEAFQRAVDLDPNSAEAWFGLGFARFGQDNNTRAEEAFQRAVALDPKSTEVWSAFGIVNYNQQKFKEAHEAFLKIVEIDPNYSKAYTNLVELHIISQGGLNALEQLDRALRSKKIEMHVRAALHLMRALTLTADENRPGAVQSLKNGQKQLDKLDPAARAEQKQALLAALLDSLKALILPDTWRVVDNYLKLMGEAAPKIHEVIGRLEHVVRYYKELEFEPSEKRRDKAAAKAQRVLDRLPSEERGPIEEMVKEVKKNMERWREIEKKNQPRAKKRPRK